MWSYFSTFLVTVQRGIRSRYSLSAGVGSNQKVVFSVKNSNFKKDTYFWGPNFKKSHKISIQNARLNLEIISFTTGFGQEVSIHAYNLKVGVHKSEKLAAAEYSLEFGVVEKNAQFSKNQKCCVCSFAIIGFSMKILNLLSLKIQMMTDALLNIIRNPLKIKNSVV